MYQITTFITLFVLFLSALAAPMPSGNSLDKRDTYQGRGTWYNPGLGACGYQNGDSDNIVAVSPGVYGSGGHCNQGVMITNTANGNQQYAQITDKCPGCGDNDLDLSYGLFSKLGNPDDGVMQISWYMQ